LLERKRMALNEEDEDHTPDLTGDREDAAGRGFIDEGEIGNLGFWVRGNLGF
jgi:hypothetical protein